MMITYIIKFTRFTNLNKNCKPSAMRQSALEMAPSFSVARIQALMNPACEDRFSIPSKTVEFK